MSIKPHVWLGAFVLAAASVLSPSAAPAQSQRPDLSGVWQRRGAVEVVGGGEVPFRPWSKRYYDETNAVMAAGEPFIDNRTICLPDGATDMMFPPYLTTLVQAPDRLFIVMEFNNQVRTVYMGEEHPADLKPTWYGHSVGRWEGDTLVVDTVGLNDRTPLMTLFLGGSTRTNIPHSTELHMIERFSLSPDGKTLRNLMTIDDPVAFTEPWTVDLRSVRQEDLRPQESVCVNDPAVNGRDGPVKLDGLIPVGPTGKTPID